MCFGHSDTARNSNSSPEEAPKPTRVHRQHKTPAQHQDIRGGVSSGGSTPGRPTSRIHSSQTRRSLEEESPHPGFYTKFPNKSNEDQARANIMPGSSEIHEFPVTNLHGGRPSNDKARRDQASPFNTNQQLGRQEWDEERKKTGQWPTEVKTEKRSQEELSKARRLPKAPKLPAKSARTLPSKQAANGTRDARTRRGSRGREGHHDEEQRDDESDSGYGGD
ncbi:hypothetical protein GGR53DRAFT_74623 [Hypoxylon sp. FL1150]|nr:hypothetical protein GGR53DRAFT_74623 [Hypoxylon sp. FL1150]